MHDGCHSDIVIIQGDTSQTNVTIEGATHEMIEAVYFSCGKLGITKTLPYDSETDTYTLLFSSEETSDIKPQITNFDITIKLFDSKILTGLYQGKLTIADKNNPVEVDDDGEE